MQEKSFKYVRKKKREKYLEIKYVTKNLNVSKQYFILVETKNIFFVKDEDKTKEKLTRKKKKKEPAADIEKKDR